MRRVEFYIALLCLLSSAQSRAEVSLSGLFSDCMVLQRNRVNAIWGLADADENISVTFAGQTHSTVADESGYWRLEMPSLPAGGPYKMVISASNTITIRDILIGDVWLCSGQSNMQMSVGQAKDADLEVLLAEYPKIRFLLVPNQQSQRPVNNVPGPWLTCSPETAGRSSAVAYFFAELIHRVTGVPIGLIESSSGGSAIEAWIPPDAFEADEQFAPLLDSWRQRIENYDAAADRKRYDRMMAERSRQAKASEAVGLPPPHYPWPPVVHPKESNHRPGNCYHAMIAPIEGYGLKGVIWYQGESNGNRGYQYRELFPLLINTWRDLWQQGDFPFYWVQLASWMPSGEEDGDSWAELREAQTLTLGRVSNTGQALAIDVGEVDDIHPEDKQTVGRRLARIALARNYGIAINYKNPKFKSLEINGDSATLRFDVEGHMESHNGNAPLGFRIAGADQVFYPASASIVAKDQIVVRSDQVAEPTAVRYAWDRAPVCNVRSQLGLPLTPFRTDDWKGLSFGKNRKEPGFGP